MHDHTTHTDTHDCCGTTTTSDSEIGSRGRNAGGASAFGAVITAVLSSACCWLPLLLLAFGASAAGVSAFFERWRPLLAVVAIAFLAVAFWQVYIRKSPCASGSCKDDACEPGRQRRGVFPQVMLWTATVFVASFVLFPKYAGVVANALYGQTDSVEATSDSSLTTMRFDVAGMTCEACAVTLQADLAKIDGVAAAEVDYDSKSAVVSTSDPEVIEQIEATAKRHGYTATPVSGDQ
ncbi:MAG: heavy metal-associated domain-containing protein [Phycisphaerales bacterium]